jgi:hypothetical protein
LLVSEAIKHFCGDKGNRAQLSRKLGLSKAAVCAWGEYVPEYLAYKLEVQTKGKIKAVPEHYEG